MKLLGEDEIDGIANDVNFIVDEVRNGVKNVDN